MVDPEDNGIAHPRAGYGTTRARRPGVSYGEVERAATGLLKAGKRPTIDALRKHLKGGAPDTIASALSRYWRELGSRIDGSPDVLSRLPAEVADLAEGIWQRALKLAADATEHRLGVESEQMASFRRRNELHSHSLSLREKELDAQLRSRERTVQELEGHLRTVMGLLAHKEETIRSLETRVHALEAEMETYRQRFTRLIARPARTTSRRRPSPPVSRRSVATRKAERKPQASAKAPRSPKSSRARRRR